MKILHIPARTPFARNLVGGDIQIVNGDGVVPIDASFHWLRQQTEFSFFDVLHVHTLELASNDDIMYCLELCQKSQIGIILTLHESRPLFDLDCEAFDQRLCLAKDFGALFATLTYECRNQLFRLPSLVGEEIAVIPHGNVLPLASPIWQQPRNLGGLFRFAIHGGFRPNKSIFCAVFNFAGSPLLLDAELHILTRAVSPQEYKMNDDIRSVFDISSRASNITVALRPQISDNEIAQFVFNSDAIVLPYQWGSHSGQLELAADLGICVVATNVGHYHEQCQQNGLDCEQMVFWADWTNTDPFCHGSEMLHAIENCFQASPSTRKRTPAARHAFRLEERSKILNAYRQLYRQL